MSLQGCEVFSVYKWTWRQDFSVCHISSHLDFLGFLLNRVLQYVTFSVYDCVISCLNRVAVLSSKYGRNDYATDVKVCVCMFASSVHITCNLPRFKKKKKKKDSTPEKGYPGQIEYSMKLDFFEVHSIPNGL